jgi:methyl-accepting chemotaxis protein
MSTKINNTADASDQIRMSVGEVAAAAEKVAQGSESLSSLSHEMEEELSFFDLGEQQLVTGAKKTMKSLSASK